MENNSENFVQKVISENNLIFDALSSTLSNAQNEILIVAAWFTDTLLFETVINRLKAGVNVQIIVADNVDNEKLPFNTINELGGYFKRVKSVGFGMMHKKFCVIDREIAIHGSYNFTVNARNNNHESVIYTTHKDTVLDLAKEFDNIKVRAQRIEDGESPNILDQSTQKPEETKEDFILPTSTIENKFQVQIDDFRSVLDSLVEGEIVPFDRDDLKRNGYGLSKECNGDPNTLQHSLDTIYNKFIDDIHVTENRKKTIEIKIEEHKSRTLKLFETELVQKQNTVKVDFGNRRESLNRIIREQKTEIEQNQQKTDSIKNIDIAHIRSEILAIENKNLEIRKEFIKPRHVFFELIPRIAIFTGLLLYLFLFYSSAAYILIFREGDIKMNQSEACEVPITVFDPNAITYLIQYDRGWMGFVYVALFFLIPISVSSAEHILENIFRKKIWGKLISYGLGLIVIDSFVALFVSKSTFEARQICGSISVDKVWNVVSDGIGNIDFWLVLVLGALPLLIFKFISAQLRLYFSERSETIQERRRKLEVQQNEKIIAEKLLTIVEKEKDIESIKSRMLISKNTIDDCQYKIDNLPLNEARELEKNNNDFATLKQHFENIADKYKNKVSNNNTRVSIDILKDRINVFLEGWNEFLHSYYSNKLAIESSKQAFETYQNWLSGRTIIV